jgi:cyclin-dependent kinase-like
MQEEFQRNPRFIGLKFPDLSKPETLEKRYLGKMNSLEVDLMSGLLEMEPEKRFTAYEAILHPYFDDIREPCFSNDASLLKH